MRMLALIAIAGCSSPRTEPPPPVVALHDAVVDGLVDAFALVPDPRRWFAGDVHMHVAPPDHPADVVMSAAQIAEAARKAELDFVVLTPHLWPARWSAAFRREWRTFARTARAESRPTLIPGVEWTTGDGHFTVAGIELDQLSGSFLPAAHAAGAFISVNHPFALPTRIPGVGASHFDMSYRRWTAGGNGFAAIDGVEVHNLPLALANLISRPGGKTGEARAWEAADRTAREERRRITAVGGTDNHGMNVMATTWVLALDPSERAIVEGLRGGATCVGGPEAGTLRIRGDAGWVRIGGSVRATERATLAWDGVARLFIDGADRGEHDGGFTHDTGGVLHTYRIEQGASRCGFVYANL
jgi:hypothetical protein